MATIQTRIRFDDAESKFFVERHYRSFIFFSYWSKCRQKRSYSTGTDVRFFESYDKARQFAIKMATDVVLTHKVNEYDPLI